MDLSSPGSYPLSYTATDAAGNANTVSVTVTVLERTGSYVEEHVIYAMADEILSRIITDDMTNEEKIKAVYEYVRKNYSYSNYTDKTDWHQAAYQMMTERHGNCFSYYAVSRLMFDRLGFPNMLVERLKTYRPYNHYWNMISTDGGQTWYYYDATPHWPKIEHGYLLTDADLA